MRKSYIAVGVVMVLILAGLGVAGRWWGGVSSKVFVTPEGKTIIKKDEKTPVQKFLKDKKPLNLLILGYGGGNHDGTYLTDTIMIVNLDPEKGRATMISIPRDTWVNIKGKNSKINLAYQLGIDEGDFGTGGQMAKEAVASVSGLPIDYFVGVDFDGFTKSIDTLGGVNINVEVAFDDPQYPIEGKEDELCGHDAAELPQITATASATINPELIFPCRYETLHFDKGTVHMDGVTALKYVRSRHSAQDGNDFGRARRQRNLITAVKQKILAINFIPKIIPFINTLGNNIRTDLTPDEVKLLLQNVSSFSNLQISNLALTDENYLTEAISSDGQSILLPKSGENNFEEIHKWITDSLALETPPTPVVVQVENGTKISGLAAKADAQIKQLGIKTINPKNADDQTYETTIIKTYNENLDSKNLNDLKQIFGVSLVEKGSVSPENFNVTVILGADYGQKQ